MNLRRFLLVLTLLGACRPDRVDVRDLTPEHRALFSEAAAIEGVGTTIHGRPGDWTVEYDFGTTAIGYSEKHDIAPGLYCKISINPDNLRTCPTGGKSQHFRITVRHELRHCDGQDHNSNPNSVMYKDPLCLPLD